MELKPYVPLQARSVFALSVVLVFDTALLAALFHATAAPLHDAARDVLGWTHPALVALVWELVVASVLWLVAFVFLGSHSGLFDVHWQLGIWLSVLLARHLPGAQYDQARSLLLLLLGLLYFLRLCYNHFTQNDFPGFLFETDWRYDAMRAPMAKARVPWWLASFLLVYVSQALMIYAAALPVFAAHTTDTPLTPVDAVAFVVTLGALIGEAVADYELQAYRVARQRDATKVPLVLMTGLWKYSRHPNYFFEVMVWAGIMLFAVPTGEVYPAIGLLVITALFLLYSIGAVEKKMMDKAMRTSPEKVALLKKYRKTTSVFVPWFPSA